jgi:hypothetical protein
MIVKPWAGGYSERWSPRIRAPVKEALKGCEAKGFKRA